MSKFLRYFLLGVLCFAVVDYTTVFNPDWQRWLEHNPEVWLFYLGYPLLFAWLIYKRNFRGFKLFFSMMFTALLFEVLFFHNPLLLIFPSFLFGYPLAFLIYGFITYLPFWIIEGELKKNRRWVLLLAGVWLIVSFLTIFGDH